MFLGGGKKPENSEETLKDDRDNVWNSTQTVTRAQDWTKSREAARMIFLSICCVRHVHYRTAWVRLADSRRSRVKHGSFTAYALTKQSQQTSHRVRVFRNEKKQPTQNNSSKKLHLHLKWLHCDQFLYASCFPFSFFQLISETNLSQFNKLSKNPRHYLSHVRDAHYLHNPMWFDCKSTTTKKVQTSTTRLNLDTAL